MRILDRAGAIEAMLNFARILLQALRACRVRTPATNAGDRSESECPSCGADFLCPLDWAPPDDCNWWVQSRCGECGHWSEMLIDNAQAARLDLELNRQQAVMWRTAERFEAERMAVEADAFIAALQRDLIDAGDFA